MKWKAALYQCIYKYEFWDVFIWACDNELILRPTFTVLVDNYLAPECTEITLLVINFSRSNNKIPVFPRGISNSRIFPVLPGVADTLLKHPIMLLVNCSKVVSVSYIFMQIPCVTLWLSLCDAEDSASIHWYARTSLLAKNSKRFLAKHCNFIAMFGYCHNMSSVCLSSETRVYCDKMIEARITRLTLNNS